MTTFEEKYRKKQGLPDAAPDTPAHPSPAMVMLRAAASDEYKAYNPMPHQELELWIRPNAANEWTDVYLPYSYRNHMISDGHGFVISMHFSTPIIVVTLHGRDLKELVHLLSKRQIEWVMEYDPRIWPELPPDKPCITGIEIRHAPRAAKKEEEDALPSEKKAPEGRATH
ncbi:MAG: hypothetical protein JO033_18500 [Acidobacteriaceae bacterium]|nr:hypothetical protein [Acidobacteriaceae bacterium]